MVERATSSTHRDSSEERKDEEKFSRRDFEDAQSCLSFRTTLDNRSDVTRMYSAVSGDVSSVDGRSSVKAGNLKFVTSQDLINKWEAQKNLSREKNESEMQETTGREDSGSQVIRRNISKKHSLNENEEDLEEPPQLENFDFSVSSQQKNQSKKFHIAQNSILEVQNLEVVPEEGGLTFLHGIGSQTKTEILKWIKKVSNG